MRFTVDLEKKEVTVFSYDSKWKNHLTSLEKVYGGNGYEIKHQEHDYNLKIESDFKTDDVHLNLGTSHGYVTYSTVSGNTITVEGSPLYDDSVVTHYTSETTINPVEIKPVTSSLSEKAKEMLDFYKTSGMVVKNSKNK